MDVISANTTNNIAMKVLFIGFNSQRSWYAKFCVSETESELLPIQLICDSLIGPSYAIHVYGPEI